MTLKLFAGSAPGPKGPDGPQGPPGGNKGVSWPLRTDKHYGAYQYARQSNFSRKDHLQVYPFIVARRRTFVQMDYYCTSGGTRGLMQPGNIPQAHQLVVGLWGDAGGYPGELLESGIHHENYDAALRENFFANNRTLEPGVYWLGGVCSSSTSAAFMVHNRQVVHDITRRYDVPGMPIGGTYWHVDFSYSGSESLPNPFPSNGVLNGGVDAVPYVVMLVTDAPTTQFDDVDGGWEFDLESEDPNAMEFNLEKGLLVYQ